jgi:hypothetical protein
MSNPLAEFPAEDFIRDFRAAGGRIGIAHGGIFQVYGDGGGGKVERSYLDRMRADPDHSQRLRRALENEVATLSPDELKRLHLY